MFFVATAWLVFGGPLQAEASWVFFSDRGRPRIEREVALQKRRSELSPRAMARRQRSGRLGRDVIAGDLAPAAAYVQAVLATGARLRSTSRWLNAVGVWATAAQKQAIAGLPFVRELRPIAASAMVPEPSAVVARRSATPDGAMTDAQLEALGLDHAHACGLDGEGVVVGMLDSGFILDHNAFAGLTVLGARDFVNDDENVGQETGDPDGQADHGTMVLSALAGWVAGEYSGAAPGIWVLLAKTEDMSREVRAEEDWWVEGLEWVEAEGASMVISSLVYSDWYSAAQMDGQTAVTTQALRAAADRGLVVFQSMGNRGPGEMSLQAPADTDGIVSVGSVDVNGEIAASSSRGPTADGRLKPDVVAPGVGVWVVLPGSERGFRPNSGTSFAAPLAAGVGAILLQAYPELTAREMVERVHLTARRNASPNNDTGWGHIDGWSAVRDHCCATLGDCEGDECGGDPCVQPRDYGEISGGGCHYQRSAKGVAGLWLLWLVAAGWRVQKR